MPTTRLPISGMSCEHCAASVTGALAAVADVDDVSVDLAAGLATVTHGDAFDPAQACAAVADVGYAVLT